jgi:hypothetical protein
MTKDELIDFMCFKVEIEYANENIKIKMQCWLKDIDNYGWFEIRTNKHEEMILKTSDIKKIKKIKAFTEGTK